MALKFLVGLYGYLKISFYESGALQDVLHLHDVLARVALAKLCHTVSRARALDGTLITTELYACSSRNANDVFVVASSERLDVRSQFNSLLYQLLLDPSERVCFEAILCVLGKSDNSERYA